MTPNRPGDEVPQHRTNPHRQPDVEAPAGAVAAIPRNPQPELEPSTVTADHWSADRLAHAQHRTRTATTTTATTTTAASSPADDPTPARRTLPAPIGQPESR